MSECVYKIYLYTTKALFLSFRYIILIILFEKINLQIQYDQNLNLEIFHFKNIFMNCNSTTPDPLFTRDTFKRL